MIDGREISDARQRAGLTQQQLAERVGVSLRTVGNWERGETVPRSREHAIRAALSDHLGATTDVGLRAASDAELLAEIARRFERGATAKAGEGSAEQPAPKTQEPAGSDTRPRPGEPGFDPADWGLAAREGQIYKPGGSQD